MKYKIKSAISLALSTVLLVLSASAATDMSFFKEEVQTIIYNETFNNRYTNDDTIDNLAVIGGKVKVVDINSSNKALMLKAFGGDTGLIVPSSNAADKDVVFSVDVMTDNIPANLTLGAASGVDAVSTSDIVFARVVDNHIYTADNRKIGKLSINKFTTISAVLKQNSVIDIYVDYKRVISNWEITGKAGNYMAVRKKSINSCYVDNLRTYYGSKPDSKIPQAAILNEYMDIIGVDDTKGDISFFDNRQCFTSNAPRYSTAVLTPKTNIINATKFDYKNPSGTSYIYMERVNSSDDCFIDIRTTIPSWARMGTKKHQYFKLEGDIKIEEFNSSFVVPQIRDTATTGSQQNMSISITSDGSIRCENATASKVIKQGEWFHYLTYFNLKDRFVEVYLNGKKVITAPITNNNIQELYHMRVSLGAGDMLGKVYLDNFEVVALDNPMLNGVETKKSSIFADDDELVEFLDGKTAIHAYGNNIHKNGVKSHLDVPGIYDADTEQYYASVSTINKAFDLNLIESGDKIDGDITIAVDGTVTQIDGSSFKLKYAPKVENGSIFIPIREFAEKAIGKYVWWFKTGIIIFSDKPVKLDTSNWEYQSLRTVTQVTPWNDIDFLNAYLQYERPREEELLSDLKATLGEDALAAHPRVMLDKADFDLHRQHYLDKDDELFTNLANKMIATADGYAKGDNWQVPYKFDDAMRTLSSISTPLLNKFIHWGYAYQLTGDQKYVDAAYKLFEQVNTYPNFNTSHIIDAGDDAFALAIGFDWLYDGFTPEQREFVKKVVRDKCLDVLAGGMYGRLTSSSNGTNMWAAFKWMSNYNSIICGGVIAASVATLEYDTDEALMYIADATRSIEYSLQMLTPDGGWNESPSYWAYAMRYIGAAGSTLENAFGTSYGLMDGQGVSNTINYIISCLGVGGVNNYGDSGVYQTKVYSYNNFFYLGKRLNNDVAVKMRRDDLKATPGSGDYYDAMYYDFDSVKLDNSNNLMSGAGTLLRTRGTEIVSIRDSYDFNESKTYFSTHYGTTYGYHQHDDVGNFVLDLMGVRWACDLGQENYNLQNELGYEEWDMYRKRAEGHNVLVLNPNKYPESHARKTSPVEFVPIADAQANEYGGFVYADMGNVYNETDDMIQGYYIDDNMNSMTYRAEYSVESETEAMWSIFTMATVTIENGVVYLSQDGKTVKIETLVKNGTDIKWEDRDPKPLPNSPQVPEQYKNDGFRKLTLTYNAKPGDNVLSVKISPAGMVMKSIQDIPIADWKLPEKSDISEGYNCNFEILYMGQPVSGSLPVFDGVMPEIEIVTEDPKAIVEIDEATSADGITTIKVWDKTRTVFSITSIKYYKASGKSMEMFNTIPIADVSVSSTPEVQNSKENIIDYDLTTRWTAMAKGEYAIADIGSVQKVDGIGAAFWKGYERSYWFDVYVSEDGENWTEAYMQGENTPGVEDVEAFGFDKSYNARYIKIVGQGNSVDSASRNNINLLELRILQSKY